MRLVIYGPPRTKKNSSRIVKVGRGLRIIPSKAQVTWAKGAVVQLADQWRRPPFTQPVHVAATFFCERNVGDLINYAQALADALQAAGVVSDDKYIESWDGTRLSKDAANPRVELTIEPLVEAPLSFGASTCSRPRTASSSSPCSAVPLSSSL